MSIFSLLQYNAPPGGEPDPIFATIPLPVCKVENLDTEGFQLAGSLFQCSDLMWDRDVEKVRIDDLYNLIIVVGEFLKLEIKIIQPGDKLRLRRVTSDDDELLGEDSFDDKPAAVMFQTSFAEQIVEADILLFIEAKKNTCNSEFWAAVFFFG